MVTRVIKIVAWNLGLTLLIVLLAELAFGSWFKAPGLWNLGVFRDVAWTDDVSRVYPRPEPVIYRRDYFGLRGSFGKPENANILVLGGSTTEERKVDDKETWAEVMGACLRQKGVEARVANAGVSGQTTRGHAANFALWLNQIPGLRPHLIIAYFGVNENQLDQRGQNDDVTRYFETRAPLSVWHNLRNWIGMNSAVLRVHKIIKGNIKAFKAGLHPLALEKTKAEETASQALDAKLASAKGQALRLDSSELAERRRKTEGEMAPELDALRERLLVLKEKIEAYGAKPVFVAQGGASYRLDEGLIWGDVEAYLRLQALARTTMEFCRSQGMGCVDLSRDFAFAEGDAYDGVHTTAQGSAKIGQAICRQFDPAWLSAR